MLINSSIHSFIHLFCNFFLKKKPPTPGIQEDPFDVVLCSDINYAENMVEHFVLTLEKVTRPGTVVWVGNEVRNETATNMFLERIKTSFVVKRIKRSKYHPDFKDQLLYILRLVRKRDKGSGAGGDGDENGDENENDNCNGNDNNDNDDKSGKSAGATASGENGADGAAAASDDGGSR